MRRDYFLLTTAVIEGATALSLLGLPALPMAVLLGVEQARPETLFVARIAGAALLALAVACWLGRGERSGPGAMGLLLGVLAYDVCAAALLAYAGLGLGLAGLALWPAAAGHLALAAWGVACLRSK